MTLENLGPSSALPNENKGPKNPLSSEPSEEQIFQEEGSLGDEPATIRNFGAILLGIAYGGSLLQGIEVGLQFVLNTEDTYVLGTLPTLEMAVIICCGILAGILGGYASHSVTIGFGSAVLMGLSWFGTTLVVVIRPDSITWDTLLFVSLGGLFGAILIKEFAFKWDLEYSFVRDLKWQIKEDVRTKAVLGVSWIHWLWLWIPWQVYIGQMVWVAYPLSPQVDGDLGTFQLMRVSVSILLLAYGVYKALGSLQLHSGLTRVQSCLRFMGWFFLFPMVVIWLRQI